MGLRVFDFSIIVQGKSKKVDTQEVVMYEHLLNFPAQFGEELVQIIRKRIVRLNFALKCAGKFQKHSYFSTIWVSILLDSPCNIL